MEEKDLFAIAIASFSSVFSTLSYFLIGSIPLTALGIGLLIFSVSLLLTDFTPIPSQTTKALLESSVLNIEAILEEFGINKKAYYVPKENKAYLLIPIDHEEVPKSFEVKGLITSIDGKNYLSLFPPAGVVSVESLEAGIYDYLVEKTGLADSVNVLDQGERIVVEIQKPKAKVFAKRFREVAGSMEASIVASVAAVAKGKVVQIESEEEEKNRRKVVLRVL
ncbi:MAG: hypothetical protein QXO16_04630 [Archaeoglobaceae archaeon]